MSSTGLVGSMHPFRLSFINRNISLCTGCQHKYTKPPQPSNDIVVQHEEWWSYVAGGVQLSKFGNAYYHCCLPCIRAKWPMFQAHYLQVSEEIIPLQTSQHKEVWFFVVVCTKVLH